jgi:hypothetical protein
MRPSVTSRKRKAERATAVIATGLALLFGLPVSPAAHGQAASAPSGEVTFLLTDPASAGAGTLGRGSISLQGKDYSFEVTGMHLAKTSADAPRGLIGKVYGLNSPADISGDYVTVGEPTAGSYVLQNAKGVRVELAPLVGSARLPPHDAAHPVTIKLTDGSAP